MSPAKRYLRRCERKVRRWIEERGPIPMEPGMLFVMPKFRLHGAKPIFHPRNRKERKAVKMRMRREAGAYAKLNDMLSHWPASRRWPA